MRPRLHHVHLRTMCSYPNRLVKNHIADPNYFFHSTPGLSITKIRPQITPKPVTFSVDASVASANTHRSLVASGNMLPTSVDHNCNGVCKHGNAAAIVVTCCVFRPLWYAFCSMV